MGRFLLGSTVVMLFPKDTLQLQPGLGAGRRRSAWARRWPRAPLSAHRPPAQTMRMPRLGSPSMWQSITSPRTTGPTFSGVPE